MKKRLTAWLLALVMALTLVGCGIDSTVVIGITDSDQPQQEQQDTLPEDTQTPDAPEDGDSSADVPAIDEDGSYTTKEDVALYIHTYGHLPGNFITKKEAQALGWSLTPPANASAAAVSATMRACCRRWRAAPTPSATSTRWARTSGARSGSCSPTTA